MTLEDAFRARAGVVRIHLRPTWTDAGLMLGVGTCLAHANDDLSSDCGERLLAILSIAVGCSADVAALGHVAAASRYWREGRKALAQLRLVYADLPRVDETDAYRLFLADHLLGRGMTPAALRKALGLEVPTSARKYSEAQARVPAGSGRESGRWTSGSSSVVEGRSVDAGSRSRTAFLDEGHGTVPEQRVRDKEHATYDDVTTADAVAHGHPIPLLPYGPAFFPFFGVPRSGARDPSPATDRDSGHDLPPGEEPPRRDRDRLCPDPTPETGGHSKESSKAYQEYVGTLVNPGEPPVPAGLAYGFSNPQSGRIVMIDHCRSSDGAFIEAKGRYAFLLKGGWQNNSLGKDFVEQARLQLGAAQAHGDRAIEWWFEEADVADFARDVFRKEEDLGPRIKVRHVAMPAGRR